MGSLALFRKLIEEKQREQNAKKNPDVPKEFSLYEPQRMSLRLVRPPARAPAAALPSHAPAGPHAR
jgi:hypothetical protein